LYATAEFMDTA